MIGARQVGKSTMLKHLAEELDRTIVTMDDDFARELALNDPRLFFQTYKPHVLIDEIQKAPNLLEHIKSCAMRVMREVGFGLQAHSAGRIKISPASSGSLHPRVCCTGEKLHLCKKKRTAQLLSG